MDIKIHTDNYDVGIINDIYENTYDIFDEVHIMPDTHRGATVPIGFVAKYDSKKGIIPNIIGVDISCLDCDTEVLTQNGWIKISEYKDEKILQYSPEENIGKFITPKRFIKKECSEFYHFKNTKSLDQMLSEDHNMLVYTRNKFENKKPIFFYETNPKALKSSYYTFKTSFVIKENGIDLSNDMIRIHIMIQADGRIRTAKKHNFIEMHLKKQKKIEKEDMADNTAHFLGLYFKTEAGAKNYLRIMQNHLRSNNDEFIRSSNN